jgi:glycosyltransferase involved in cell wall biosynthesis
VIVDDGSQDGTTEVLKLRLAEDLPARETSFRVAGVPARGAREAICAHFTQRGWI